MYCPVLLFTSAQCTSVQCTSNKETIYTVQSYLQVVEHTHLPHPTDESHQSQILRYQCTNGQLLFQMTSNCQGMLQMKI